MSEYEAQNNIPEGSSPEPAKTPEAPVPCTPCKKTSIGGQALIEGIMMRGPHRTMMAVRDTHGKINLEEIHQKPADSRPKILRLPIIRGVLGYVDSLVFGYKALMRSADLSGMTELEEEEETRKKAEKAAKKEARRGKEPAQETPDTPLTETEVIETVPQEVTEDPAPAEPTEDAEPTETAEPTKAVQEIAEAPAPADKKEKDDSALMTVIVIIGTVLGIGLAFFLFLWLPAFLFDLFNKATVYDFTRFKGLLENLLKILILVGYMASVSLMKDIRRTFMYHGAEHKTIACYEAGLPLTVENCRVQRRFHPRCGTSFLILMLLVSILVSTLLIFCFPALAAHRMLWILIKFLLIPLICGLGYELIKFCGRHDNLLTRIISAPGMWLQRLTTKEPTDDMLEVAICAMEAVIPENTEDDKW